METKPVDVYSDASNDDIVGMPGRRFPGCVIQGDSLSILLSMAEVILRESKTLKNQPVAEAAEELYADLRDRLDHYESVVQEHGLGLPYVKRPDA